MRRRKRTCAGRRARALRWTATPTTRRPSLLRSLPTLPRLASFTPCARLLTGSAAPNGRRLRPDRLRLAQGLHRSLTLLHLSPPLLRSLARSVRSLGRSLRSNVPRHRQPSPRPRARAPARANRLVNVLSSLVCLLPPGPETPLNVISLSGQVREDGRARRRRSATWPCCVCATLTTPPPSETALSATLSPARLAHAQVRCAARPPQNC